MPTPSPARVHECTVVKNEPIARDIFALRIASPELARKLEARRVAAHGNDVLAAGDGGAHDGAHAHGAAAKDRDRVLGSRLGNVDDGAGAGLHAAAERRDVGEVNVVVDLGHALGIDHGVGRKRRLAEEHAHVLAVLVQARGAVGSHAAKVDLVEVLAVVRLVVLAGGAGAVKGVRHAHVVTGLEVRDALADLLATGEYDVVYTCGPEVMMAGVARLCREAGVACRVSMERMMCCGFGACGTCNVAMADGTYKSCCKDGPVFDAEEVAW